MKPLLRQWLFHGFFFVATFAMTTFVNGPLYAVSIMTILLAHELGHYLVCRKYGVGATFPLFIPMPNVLGTMGAVIAMKSPIPSRKALFDIGIAGPMAGLLITPPVLVIGLRLSSIAAVPTEGPLFYFGEPLLFRWIADIVVGPRALGTDLFLHPVAFAAWAALFVTSINFFPLGQLDGGHVSYAILGQKRARQLSWIMVGVLLFLGWHSHPMWYVFALLALLFLFRHPPPIDDITPLDAQRRLLGFAFYLFMILCFSPVPFDLKM